MTASNPNLLFQYIQKLVVLSSDRQSVLVAKRKGEADYDGTFSFIGGKMETTDESLIAGMKRLFEVFTTKLLALGGHFGEGQHPCPAVDHQNRLGRRFARVRAGRCAQEQTDD